MGDEIKTIKKRVNTMDTSSVNKEMTSNKPVTAPKSAGSMKSGSKKKEETKVKKNQKVVPLNKIKKLPEAGNNNVGGDALPKLEGNIKISAQLYQRYKAFYNDNEKENKDNILKNAGINVPRDLPDLVSIRSAFMEKYKKTGKDGKKADEYRWKETVSQEIRDTFDWLSEYYKVNNNKLEFFIDDKQDKLPKKEYHASVKGLNGIYEKQGTNNCYACAGTAMLNQFISNRNKEAAATRRFGQQDLRNFIPRIKKFRKEYEAKGYADRKKYDGYIKEIDKYCGEGKSRVGNIFEMGDFFLEKPECNDAMLNKMIFQIPADSNSEKDDIKTHNMREVFKEKVNEVVSGGNVLTLLMTSGESGHYVTVTGINGEEIEYLDSDLKNGNHASIQRKNVEYFMKRPEGGNTVEITWLSQMKAPEQMTAEYSNLKYDAQKGYSLKELNEQAATDVSHVKGLAVAKEFYEMGKGMDGISLVSYIPNPLAEAESEPIEEYRTRAGAGSEPIEEAKQIRERRRIIDEEDERERLALQEKEREASEVRSQIRGEDWTGKAKKRARKKAIRYEKKYKDYTTFGVGFSLKNVGITAADSGHMKRLKKELSKYLKIRNEVFDRNNLSEMDAKRISDELLDISSVKPGLTLIIHSDKSLKRNGITDSERETLGEAYDSLMTTVDQYLTTRSSVFKFGRGRARLKQVRSIKQQLRMDNIRFYLSEGRRDLYKSVDADYEKGGGGLHNIMPTWLKMTQFSDMMELNRQAYKDKRVAQRQSGNIPPWYMRMGEWLLVRGIKNNALRVLVGINFFGGLVDRTLGVGSMLAANTLELAGKVIKAPIKVLSSIFNFGSKYIARSRRRWKVKYNLGKGWKSADDGRRIFRRYLKSAFILPAAVAETFYRGIPYIFGKRYRKGVYKHSGKWTKDILKDVGNVFKSIGFAKDYSSIKDRSDEDVRMAGFLDIDKQGDTVSHDGLIPDSDDTGEDESFTDRNTI